jgi:hypothetical protein
VERARLRLQQVVRRPIAGRSNLKLKLNTKRVLVKLERLPEAARSPGQRTLKVCLLVTEVCNARVFVAGALQMFGWAMK